MEAARKGHTREELADHLGVSYRRLAHWHGGQGDIRHAKPAVFLAAARYLRVPRVAVLAYAGVIGLDDLVWPELPSRDERLQFGLQALRRDAFLGAFLPESAWSAPADLQAFLLLMAQELQGQRTTFYTARWVEAIAGAIAEGRQVPVGQPVAD